MSIVSPGFVEARVIATGDTQWVPEHWLDDPVLGAPFERVEGSPELSAPPSGALAEQGARTALPVPAGNASRDDWAAYARSVGATEDDLTGDDGQPLGRDAIRDTYAPTGTVPADNQTPA